MKLYITDNNSYFEGVRLTNDGVFEFDKFQDLNTDIVYLHSKTSGKVTRNGLTYYFAYTFNPKADKNLQKSFRDYLKHSFHDPDVCYSEEAYEFVENGVLQLDSMKRLDSFDVVICTASSVAEQSLAGLMCSIVWDNVPNSIPCYNMRLIKKLCKDVTFDEEKAYQSLILTNKYNTPQKAHYAIKRLKLEFEKAKKENKLFTMKRYTPVHGRAGFMDFLKFPTVEQQELYETLRNGAEVLICDDFLTTGSTVKEAIRFLNSINPNTKISIFVMMDQYRQI